MTIPFIVNHLWQSSCFTLLAGVLAFLLRKNSPKVRYWVWMSASLKFLIPFAFLVSFGSVVPRPLRHPVSLPVPAFSNTVVQIAVPFPPAPDVTAPTQTPLRWVPVTIAVLWALGFSALTVVRCHTWLSFRAALRTGTPIELPIPVPALIMPGAEEPGIFGFLRPVLVLPDQLLEHLNPQQLDTVLTHEMCHVRRRDNFFAAVHMAVEAIFWFHPLVWWIGSRIVEERELACDEEVLRTGCEATDYFQAILKVCRFYTDSPSPCISGVTGADIKMRLRTILAGRIARDLSGGKKLALAAIALAALGMPILIGMLNAPAIRAQDAPAAKPTFEIASIKPTGSHGGGSMRPSPGRLTASAPLRVLMQAAYHVQDFQIVGAPEWVKSDGYAVDAKASGNPRHAQMMLMLQSLLEDRFHLRVHHESRDMPVYTLAAARGGLNLSPPRDGNCTERDAPPPAPGDPTPAPGCGGIDVLLEAGGWHMRGGKVPMVEFVRKLSEVLGRTVTDQTGFSGVFDVNLEFRRDLTTDFDTRAGLAPPPGAIPAETTGPSIFSAVQQLGLRLESAKEPVEVIVIDHVEKPSAN